MSCGGLREGPLAPTDLETTEGVDGRGVKVIGKPPSIQSGYAISLTGHDEDLLSYKRCLSLTSRQIFQMSRLQMLF